jgi:V8-like Glu-specific endopeptidase
VGRLGARAPDRLGHCTASLVAPDRALTAAHCVTKIRRGQLIPLVGMRFFAGADAEGRPYFARVTDVQPHPGAYAGGEQLDTRHDVALLRLDPPLPVPPLAVAMRPAGGAARLVGFPRGGPLQATVQAPCASAPGVLWRLGCPVRSGQSGSPVFLDPAAAAPPDASAAGIAPPAAGPSAAEAARTVVAVVVATSGSDALAVPVDPWLLMQLGAPLRGPVLP